MNKMEEANLTESSFVLFRVGPDEDIVRADKNLLMRDSSVFRAMLAGPLAEKGEIKIPDSSQHVFSEFIGYLQTGRLYDPEEDVTDILYLAKKYDVDRLTKFCLSYLRNNLSPETAPNILQLAYTYDEKILLEDAVLVIMNEILEGNIPTSLSDVPVQCFNLVMRSELCCDDSQITAVVSAWADKECNRQCLQANRRNISKVLGGEFVPEFIKVSFLGKTFGWIYFTCNLDVILHGIICHALHDMTVLHVEIFVPLRNKNRYIVKNDIEISSNPSDDETVILRLSRPLYLGKDIKYSLQILSRQRSGASQFCFSKDTLECNVDKYKFSVSKGLVIPSREVISGLVVSDVTLWRENRVRRLGVNYPPLRAHDTTGPVGTRVSSGIALYI